MHACVPVFNCTGVGLCVPECVAKRMPTELVGAAELNGAPQGAEQVQEIVALVTGRQGRVRWRW